MILKLFRLDLSIIKMEDWILTLINKPKDTEKFKKYLFEYCLITNEKYSKYEEQMPFTIKINFKNEIFDNFYILSNKRCFLEFSFIDNEIKINAYLFKKVLYETYDVEFFKEILMFIKYINQNFDNIIHQEDFEFDDLQDFSECIDA